MVTTPSHKKKLTNNKKTESNKNMTATAKKKSF